MGEFHSDFRDYPVEVIAESMKKQAARGAVCYQKWTCAGCGDRVTASEPNTVYLTAKHDGRVFHNVLSGETTEDEGVCGAVTDIEKQGCNFMFVLQLGRS